MKEVTTVAATLTKIFSARSIPNLGEIIKPLAHADMAVGVSRGFFIGPSALTPTARLMPRLHGVAIVSIEAKRN
jgi:hypothetical protein